MPRDAHPYRVYWVTWGLLLVITLGMLAAEALHLPRGFLVVFLLVFLMVKAVMIAGNFMHLRFEQRSLAWAVGGGSLITSLVLLAFLTPEAWSVLARTVR